MKFSKRNLLIFILLLGLFACQSDNSDIISELKQVGEDFIPDSRLEIFDIDEKDDSVFVKTSSTDAYNELTKNPVNLVYPTLLPEKTLETRYGVINLSAANMRSTHRHGADMVTQGIMGMPVKIYDKRGSWSRIQTPDYYMGWADGASVHPMTEKEFRSWNQSPKVIFTDYTGFVYTDPNRDGDVVSDAVLGNMYQYRESDGNFYAVVLPDGRQGYVLKTQAQPKEEWLQGIELTGESLVAMARKFMGIPYLWGGTSFKGMDCSGFTKILYFMHGIILQRDASQQVLYGIEVPTTDNYKELQKGDLLFFGGGERITHVGMYIGNQEFIHEAGRVKINSLDKNAENYSGYRANSLRKVRRIIGAEESFGITKITNNNFYK